MPDETQDASSAPTIRDSYNEKRQALDAAGDELDALLEDAEADEEAIQAKQDEFDGLFEEVQALKSRIDSKDARERARAQFKPLPVEESTTLRDSATAEVPAMTVSEPDLYTREGRSFFSDLYAAKLMGDPAASERIARHQRFEAEQRAVAMSTLGGIIPPAYLIDLYAKASRNGRIFADQVNHQALPEQGPSVIVPRLTQGLAAGAQTSESTAVSTQDPTETDLTVPVRTVAGYSPVSRQSLERSLYSDAILFEDLIARYWASLDVQALNGTGGSGQFQGLIGTSGIVSSTATTITAAGVYPKIADCAQQIATNMGGIGYLPDKVFMHPRRWAFFAAALDSQNRPLIVPSANAYNPMGVTPGEPAGGVSSGFGGPVGSIQGFPVWLDPNIPTNLGTNTNEDRIIVTCSPVVHLWERPNDPVTVSFEQQAGTSLQVQLVVFGYAAFTAGRYPGASGVVTGLTPPTF